MFVWLEKVNAIIYISSLLTSQNCNHGKKIDL